MQSISSLELVGIHYLEFFDLLSRQCDPMTYFEIGTNTGASTEKFGCDTVCVDPKFLIERNIYGTRKRTLLFQMTSDDFFRSENLRAFFPSGPDISFLDGMHLFEYLLKDFINVEKTCHKRSLVLLHDCLPLSPRMGERPYRGGDESEGEYRWAWTGDVWKLLPILKRFRPDLHIRLVDCPPTGIVAISNLDPSSTVLEEQFERIVADFAEEALDDARLAELRTMYPMVKSRRLAADTSLVSAYFNCR